MNYFAHTTALGTNYPAYISINDDLDGNVSVTVRTEGKQDGSHIQLTKAQLHDLAVGILAKTEQTAMLSCVGSIEGYGYTLVKQFQRCNFCG